MRNSLSEADRAFILHPQTDPAALDAQGPLIIERGEGVFVTDVTGRSYLEGCRAYGAPRLASTKRGWRRLLRIRSPSLALITPSTGDPILPVSNWPSD